MWRRLSCAATLEAPRHPLTPQSIQLLYKCDLHVWRRDPASRPRRRRRARPVVAHDPPDPESPPKPCDYFDLIGGTSTGGLIAIMLGRLQLTVGECIDAYTSLSDKVFEKKRHRATFSGKLQGRFDTAGLERAVRQILQDCGKDEDTLLKDSADAPCKVYG